MILIVSGQHGKMTRDGEMTCHWQEPGAPIPATTSKLEKKQTEKEEWDLLDFWTDQIFGEPDIQEIRQMLMAAYSIHPPTLFLSGQSITLQM